ncbi:rhs-associated protein [Paenibacillus sp. 19GGS1-52]|uniref:rhs-associated protein n=1 Tax=Paenibacillus sp. 19GGS1-52 TaxID=2758563 RepID=UPI001EFC1B00|nr:rhs-associated protein [Paenibacillus sp. 19GGS1-52]ULO09547.1 rhs-associated protein [Paenibacillus sp. 19GGS1-52]
MSIFDDELVKDLVLNEQNMCVEVIKNPEKYLNIIEQKFEFNGSKIDWLQTNKHHSKESNIESLLTDASLFITELTEKYLNDNVQVMYLGDSLTEFGYQFEIKDLEQILVYFLDIPQHHYFIPLEGDWCLCISHENYLDFGFSFNRD